MTRPDLLDAMVRDLDFEIADGKVSTVTVPDMPGLPDNDAGLRSNLVAGLFHLVAEAVTADMASNDERAARIRGALSAVESIVVVAHFALFERTGLAERQELAARMQGREVAMTRSWLVPRLKDDIAAYRARIEALQRALEAG